MDLEKTVSILKQDLSDNPDKLDIEKNTLEKYGKLFAYDNLDNITSEQFQEFCDFKNNHHWTISRHKTNLTKDMPKLRKSLKILLDETIPIANRLKRLRDTQNPDFQKYLGEAYFSPILLVAHPDKYSVYNETVKGALDELNLSKTTSRDIWERYPEVQNLILGFAQQHNLSLWQMDWVWWKVIGAKSFGELLDYIEDEKKMVMVENFQPVILRKILKSKSATKEELDNELDKYSKNSKTPSSINTVLDVLQRERNQMIRKEEHRFVINSVNELSEPQTEKLIDACNKRLEEFELDKKPLDITFKEAAIKVLQEAKEPLHYKEITRRAIQNNLITSKGQTPELTLLKNVSEDIKINKDKSIFKKTDIGVYTLNENDETRFFIALGPWSNWEHIINNPPFRWGVNPSSASNVGVFNALRPGDVIYYYANQDKPTPFSKRGLFGVGKVTRKYDEDSERYWPDEKLKDEIIYKHRFEIESLKLVQSDSEMLPWIDGLPFTKGLNRIANKDTLKQLIDNTEKLWDIKLDSSEIKYWKIAPGEAGEDWENQKSRGLIGIHFFDFDLTGLTGDELRKKISEKYGAAEVAKRANTFGQVRNFLSLKEGDIVVANSGKSKILGIGRVAGPYKFRKDEKYPHTFPVDWYDTTEGTIPKQEGWMATVSSLQKEEFEELTKLRVKYLLLRHSTTSVNQWRDDVGKKYHFRIAPNYKKLVPGTKTIWFDRERSDDRYWGYGEVSRIEEDSENNFHAVFDHFNFFNDPKKLNPKTEDVIPKKGSIAVKEKIMNLSGWNNQNSILEITKDIYDEIISGDVKSKPMSGKTFVDSPLIFPRDNLDSIKDEIKKELLIDDHIIDQIITSLYSGKNVLLTGPVGTGKTHLAQLIPKLAWKEIGGYYPQTVTATSDWTTQDVIGGIFPKIKNNEITYLIQKGCVAETVSQNWENKQSSSKKRDKKVVDGHEYNGVWLVIDEFNRANIDKAFGQLFTALEYKTLDIPTTDPELSSEKLTIPEDYRIIGTLNTFDKHFLFRLSDALKRRFSFIEILPPAYSKKQEEIKFIAEKAIKGLREVQEELKINSYDDIKKNSSLMSVLENLYEIMAYIRLTKNLGTALLISMFRFILINYLITKDWDKSLDQALMTNLLPQLESLQYWQIDSVMNFMGGRIHELFRRFDIRNRPDVDRYEEELKTLTKYLKISGKNKNAHNWNSKFRTGEIMRENNPISDLNPWNEITRPNLRNFRMALESLKQEKGFFETEDISEDLQ